MPVDVYKRQNIGIIGSMPEKRVGKIVIATGGTSDIPVAEEAAVTSEMLGNNTMRLYDVGVAGIHRLLAHTDEIMTARVIICLLYTSQTPFQSRSVISET